MLTLHKIYKKKWSASEVLSVLYVIMLHNYVTSFWYQLMALCLEENLAEFKQWKTSVLYTNMLVNYGDDDDGDVPVSHIATDRNPT